MWVRLEHDFIIGHSHVVHDVSIHSHPSEQAEMILNSSLFIKLDGDILLIDRESISVTE